MSESTDPLYPISETLIAEYVAQGRADLLLSLFNSIKSQRDRAERMCAIYQSRIFQLEKREARGDGMMYVGPKAQRQEPQAQAPKSQTQATPKPKPQVATSLASLL